MGGSKLDEKDLKKGRDSMAKYLSGVKKTKPMAKHSKILQDSGESELVKSSQVKLVLSPKQRAKPAASRTRTCTNAAVCIASGGCPSRF
jgi:predicted SnoaL-like aldol condensation-catalyzing enzyme